MTDKHVFPTAIVVGEVAKVEGGLTLRDYFAAKAMQAMVAYTSNPNYVANAAYQFANAMMEQREKE